MTLALPNELHAIMKKRKEIKWAEIARQAIWDTAKKLELMDKLLANSELKEEESVRLGKKINSGIAKRHKIS